MSGWNQASCCCGAGTIENPCEDCGQYGTICCLKLTDDEGTWFFRHSGATAHPRLVDYYVDGDVCVSRDNSNLCGSLLTCGPCSVYGRWLDPLSTLEPRRHAITWRVADDCSEVILKLYYAPIGGGVPDRYEVSVPTDWITSGLPVTIGPFTLSECQYYEPFPKQVNICCWQMVFAADGITTTGVNNLDPDPCLAAEPRVNEYPTEQCMSSTSISLQPGVEPITFIPWVNQDYPLFGYVVSEDYSVIRWHLTAGSSFDIIGLDPGGLPRKDYSWDVEGTVPFTSDWFLTPIVVPATWARPGLDPENATITISVCGYVVAPPPPCGGSLDCFPDCISGTVDCDGVTPAHSLLFVDIDEAGETWDGYHNLQYSEDNNQYEMLFGGGGLTITITLGCSGTDVVLTVTIYSSDLNDTQTNSYTSTLSCTGGATPEINDISFTLQWPEAGIYAGATIFSNNNGLR